MPACRLVFYLGSHPSSRPATEHYQPVQRTTPRRLPMIMNRGRFSWLDGVLGGAVVVIVLALVLMIPWSVSRPVQLVFEVIDAQSGAPINGAAVHQSDDDGDLMVPTDKRGQAQFS